MLLNTFFLRYKADTGEAVKNIEKLDEATEKSTKTTEKNSRATKKSAKESGAAYKEFSGTVKDLGNDLGQLGEKGTNAFTLIRSGAGIATKAVGKIGAAGIVAAVGIGAIVAAIKIGNSAIEGARAAANDSILHGQSAFAARQSQNELIRLQSQGRVRGLSDQESSQSAQGLYDRASEIRAAQRQAARDPASAFNNPLIKQANLWKKAGVDVAASMETQVAQQNSYLHALAERGEQERALVEGTQLFGRTLADVKSVITSTRAELNSNTLAMAKENVVRRSLQKSGEDLATAEGKLEAVRKHQDERLQSKTVPATREFTEALTEWQRALAPIKDVWAEIVSAIVSGMAYLLKKATSFLNTIGLGGNEADERRNEYINSELEKTKEKTQRDYIANNKSANGSFGTSAQRKGLAEAVEKAMAERRAELETEFESKRVSGLTAQTGVAADSLVDKSGGKLMFGTKELTAEELQQAMAGTEEAIKNDPNIQTLDDIKVILSDQLSKVKEQNKVVEAQTAFTRKIESNTAALINTGLEQALSLWAANVGKAGGMSTGSFQGETREDYEKRMRVLQRTVNPNTARQISEARNTVGEFSSQASSINRLSPSGAAGGSRSMTFGDIKVEVNSAAQDAAGIAKEIGSGIRDELTFLVSEFADARIS